MHPTHARSLLLPVQTTCISSPFGPRVLPHHPQAGTYHYGVDLPASEGAPVLAAAPGAIMRIQNKGPGGLEVLVQHANFVGVYSHLGMIEPVLLNGKSTVTAGEKIGTVGHTGVTFGMHLYFAMLRGGAPVDPAPYLTLPVCSSAHQPSRTLVLDSNGKIAPTHFYQLERIQSAAR